MRVTPIAVVRPPPLRVWTLAPAAPALATGAALALDRYFSVAGLAMVYLIAVAARLRGGRIEARREHPGAEFRIDLPVGAQPPQAP